MKATAFSLPFGRGCDGAAMSRRDFPVTALGTESAPIAAGRQQYLKDRTMGPAEGHRQTPAMIFYDRPADRQTHAHAMRLCRKERLEDAVDVFGIDAHSGVFHRNQQMIESIYFSFYAQNPRPIVHGTHCVDGVPGQVHDDLLQLDSIGRNLREFVEQLGANRYTLDFPIPRESA